MNLCFDREMLRVLTPEEIIYVSICIEEYNGTLGYEGFFDNFIESTAYENLLCYYSEEMPYGIAKARTGEPDIWMLEKSLVSCVPVLFAYLRSRRIETVGIGLQV